MKIYLKKWDSIRVLRLALGIFIIGQGIVTNDWTFITFGGLFSLMPLLNMGCFGTSSCNTTVRKNNNAIEDISHEEVR